MTKLISRRHSLDVDDDGLIRVSSGSGGVQRQISSDNIPWSRMSPDEVKQVAKAMGIKMPAKFPLQWKDYPLDKDAVRNARGIVVGRWLVSRKVKDSASKKAKKTRGKKTAVKKATHKKTNRAKQKKGRK